MSAVEDRLAEIAAWGRELGDASSGPPEQFEAAEHISELVAALRAVLAEHRRGPRRVRGVLVNPPWCQEGETDDYPCTTLVALAGGLGVTL